jgi:hypothetical protein
MGEVEPNRPRFVAVNVRCSPLTCRDLRKLKVGLREQFHDFR